MANQNESIPISDDMCYTKVNFRKCSYLWVIDNFMAVHDKRKETLISLPFSADNDEFKWQLHLNPHYDSSWISLQLYPDNTFKDFTEHSPITGELKFSVMNPENVETCTQNKEFILKYPSGDLHAGFSNFVTKTTLTNEDGALLPHDRLTIFCQVSYIKATDVVHISAKPYSKKPEEREPDTLDGIESLLMNEEFSDVTLIVEGKKYPAHKSILVARSPVFRAAFTHDMEEKQNNSIDIKDMKIPAFEEMLRYIYSGTVRNLPKFAPELLAAADKYDIKNLKIMCEKELYEKLSLGTVVSTLMLADLYRSEELKKQALLFIRVHSYNSSILSEKDRESLIESCPRLLLEIIDTLGK